MVVVGVLVSALMGAWFVYFVWLVGTHIVLVRQGKNPTALLKQQRFQASVAKTLEVNKLNADDLTRIEPKGPEPTMGNPNAKVRIIEFVDYQCPYSKQVAPVIREFMKKHSDEASLTLRNFPVTELYPDAERVAVAARCVFEQIPNRYWEFHDRLFASQPQQSVEDLRLYASQAGANVARYDDCVALNRPLSQIKQSISDGEASGVIGTPTFFFNGVKIQGAMDAESLEVIFGEVKKTTVL